MTSSCSRESNDVIPDVYLNIRIPTGDPVLFNLAPSTSITLTSNTPIDWGGSSAGFDGNGIIIYYDPFSSYTSGGFSAFDCTCPYCYEANVLSKAVNSDGDGFALCPECGTNYALPSGGAPLSGGPGRYQLKNYHAESNGYILHVWNKK